MSVAGARVSKGWLWAGRRPVCQAPLEFTERDDRAWRCEPHWPEGGSLGQHSAHQLVTLNPVFMKPETEQTSTGGPGGSGAIQSRVV
jgi:hypothetical protein